MLLSRRSRCICAELHMPGSQHREKQNGSMEREVRKGINWDATEQEESSTSTLKIVLNFELRVI